MSVVVRRERDDPLHFERGVRADLRQRRWLRVHAFLLGSLCFLACWGLSAALMRAAVVFPMKRFRRSAALTK